LSFSHAPAAVKKKKQLVIYCQIAGLTFSWSSSMIAIGLQHVEYDKFVIPEDRSI